MLLKHFKLNEHEQKLTDMSNEEFDNYMMSNYPDMFKNRNVQEGQKVIYPMNFGFEIGRGWRHVLDNLCKKLKVISDLTGLVCVFDQIKEKLGGARFYYHIENNQSEEVTRSSNTSCEIMDDLVASYEAYCDYICDELGTNIRPEEKIVIYGWYYGCGIEGFKKIASDIWGKYAEERIKEAEKHIKRTELKKEIKENLYYLNNEEIESLNKMTKKYIDAKKK